MKNNQSSALFKKVEATRSALNQLLTQKVEASIFYAEHRLFEMRDKPGHLLARLAVGRCESKTISSLKDQAGRSHHKTKMLVEIMETLYLRLYCTTTMCHQSLSWGDLLVRSHSSITGFKIKSLSYKMHYILMMFCLLLILTNPYQQ